MKEVADMIYNDDEAIDLGSIELVRNGTKEYLLKSSDVDKLDAITNAPSGSKAWCTDTHELYILHLGKWIKQ